MGKILIIKGADFSANGMKFPINITELITTFVDGRNGITGNSGGVDVDRKAVYPRFSIESYRQAGYSKISINVKSLGCFPIITFIGPEGNCNNNRYISFDSTNTYLNKGEYTLDLEQVDLTYIYFGLNILKTMADVSSDNLSDYIEITMEKA